MYWIMDLGRVKTSGVKNAPVFARAGSWAYVYFRIHA